MITVLSHQMLVRQGLVGSGATEEPRTSADFRINGESLLGTILLVDGGHGDFMGAFVRGFPEPNAEVAAQITGECAPTSESGRVLLYICPECGDIGCGAYSARVDVGREVVLWSEFAYENGYEPARLLAGVGPFEFDANQYKAAIAAACAV